MTAEPRLCADQEYLRTVQYATDRNLAARQALDRGEELLARTFGSVTRHDFAGKLLIPGPEPVAGYVRSMGITRDRSELDDIAAAVTGRLRFGTDGLFRVRTHAGCLICR